MRKTKNKINNRGHFLAVAMLTGKGRKEPKLDHTPLFGNQRKPNTDELRRPENSENIEHKF